jgi:hypothetical protein
MIGIEIVRKYALSLPGVEKKSHFGMPSFRIRNRIFATLWIKESRVMLKLSPVDQSVFCSYDSALFFPVPGGWGTKGATFADMKKIRKSMFKDALTLAYNEASKKKQSKKSGGV